MLRWLRGQQRGSSEYSTIGPDKEPRLLCLNAFKPHLTPTVRAVLKEQKTTLSVILGGCTGYIQPLDVSLNKPLKDLIQEEWDDHYDQHIKDQQKEKFNIGERRILLTYQVAKAWKRLHAEYKETIINTFRAVRLSLNPNGSKDNELKVKGLPHIAVGDYARNNLTQLKDCELAIEVAEVEAACQEAREEVDEQNLWDKINEGDQDEEERGIGTYVSDLVRPRRDNRRNPAEDMYYLAQEAEDGDPLVFKDPDNATMDTESHIAADWDEEDEDEDEDFNPDEDISAAVLVPTVHEEKEPRTLPSSHIFQQEIPHRGS